MRAVELGLGVASPDEIEIVTDDDESEAVARVLREILNATRSSSTLHFKYIGTK